MAVPLKGAIKARDLQDELGGGNPMRLSEYYRGGAYTLDTAANKAVSTEGRISYSMFRGVVSTVDGTWMRDVPGDYEFTVPKYASITITVEGAGGGGGSGPADYPPYSGGPGGIGTQTRYGTTMTAESGTPGQGQFGGKYGFNGSPGIGGTAAGGDTNTTGGGRPGGAAGNLFGIGNAYGGPGGAGGKAVKTYVVGAAGAPARGSKIPVTIGSGGVGGLMPAVPFPDLPVSGRPGFSGRVTITWT